MNMGGRKIIYLRNETQEVREGRVKLNELTGKFKESKAGRKTKQVEQSA